MTCMRTRLISQPSARPASHAEPADDQAFDREHRADLAARHAEVAQHAELAPPRERLRTEARAHAEEADQHGGDFQRVGDRERAIEYRERDRLQLARRWRSRRLPRPRKPRACAARRSSSVAPLARCSAASFARASPGELRVERAVDDDRAVLPRVVAPDAGHREAVRDAAERQLDACRRCARAKQIGGDFGQPGGRRCAVGRRQNAALRTAAAAARLAVGNGRASSVSAGRSARSRTFWLRIENDRVARPPSRAMRGLLLAERKPVSPVRPART